MTQQNSQQMKTRLQVLHIVAGLPDQANPWYQPFIASQIASLQDQGVSVEILDLAKCFGRGLKKYLYGIFELRKRIKNNHYDLIHAHYSYCGWVARTQFKLPVIVSLMGNDLLGTPDDKGQQTLRGWADILLSRILTNMVDHVIVKSNGMLKMIPKKAKSTVIPNGVDFELFKPLDRHWALGKLGVEPDQKIILFPSDPNDKRKNFALAQMAFQELRRIYGGPCMLFLFWHHKHAEIPIAMNAADILVITSYWEGSPNIVKEAMACNLPIVSVGVGDVQEVIQDTKNCYLTSYNPTEIAFKLKLVLETGGRSDGRQHIEHLRLETVARRLIKTYEKVITNA